MKIFDIMMREVKDPSKIYLYEEDGYWCAYEQSAILISRLLRGVVTMTDYALGNLILNKVRLSTDCLAGLNIISCSDSELVISYTDMAKV